jgi:hypothetical protein
MRKTGWTDKMDFDFYPGSSPDLPERSRREKE